MSENKEVKIKYRVAWKHKTNPGDTGHGNWSEDYNLIKDWVDEENKKYPDLKHWIENDTEIKK